MWVTVRLQTPFSKFQALPSRATPVTEWGSRKDAFADIVSGIRRVALDVAREKAARPPRSAIPRPPEIREEKAPERPPEKGIKGPEAAAGREETKSADETTAAPDTEGAEPAETEPAKAEPSEERATPSPDTLPDTVAYYTDYPAVVDRLERRQVAWVLWQMVQQIQRSRSAPSSPNSHPARPHSASNGLDPKAFMLHIQGPWGSRAMGIREKLAPELPCGILAEYMKGHEPARRWNIHGLWRAATRPIRDFFAGLIKRECSASPGKEPEDPARQRWIVINFNAWQHQRVGAPWWSLMNEVYRQGIAQAGEMSRLRAWVIGVRETLWRLKSRWGHYLLAAAALLWIIAFAFLSQGGTMPGSTVPGTTAPPNPWAALDAPVKVFASLLTIWGGLLTIGSYMVLGSARGSQIFLEVSRDPMPRITRHYDHLIRRLRQPVAVFIDDLDRCESAFVVDLLQAIQTLFRGAPVVYVVAADRDWVCASFQQVYKGFADCIKEIKEPGRPLGFLFLEKMFQLSISLPRLSGGLRDGYWQALLSGAWAAPEEVDENQRRQAQDQFKGLSEQEVLEKLEQMRQQGMTPTGQRAAREAAIGRLAESDVVEETRHFLQDYARLVDPNPRSMKRLLNTYRFQRDVRFFAVPLQPEDAAAQAGQEGPPEGRAIRRARLALWSIIELRWPILADFLAAYPDRVGYIGAPTLPDSAAIPAELKDLFRNPAVKRVIDGSGLPYPARLDAAAIRSCIGHEISMSATTPPSDSAVPVGAAS